MLPLYLSTLCLMSVLFILSHTRILHKITQTASSLAKEPTLLLAPNM